MVCGFPGFTCGRDARVWENRSFLPEFWTSGKKDRSLWGPRGSLVARRPFRGVRVGGVGKSPNADSHLVTYTTPTCWAGTATLLVPAIPRRLWRLRRARSHPRTRRSCRRRRLPGRTPAPSIIPGSSREMPFTTNRPTRARGSRPPSPTFLSTPLCPPSASLPAMRHLRHPGLSAPAGALLGPSRLSHPQEKQREAHHGHHQAQGVDAEGGAA